MILPKTLNLYWVFGTSLMVWFLFIHSPSFLYQRFKDAETFDIAFALHLQGAYTISIVCMINTLITPSMFGGRARIYHVWLGRFGLLCGISSFLFGLYCSWWPYRTNLPPLAFSISITLGGIGQLLCQYIGYTNIRNYYHYKEQIQEKQNAVFFLLQQQQQQQHDNNNDNNTKLSLSRVQNYKELIEEIQVIEKKKSEALRGHIKGMILLFIIGCGAPSLIRLIGEFFPNAGASSVLLSVLALNIIAIRYIHTLVPVLLPTPPETSTSSYSLSTNTNDIPNIGIQPSAAHARTPLIAFVQNQQ